MSLSEQVKYLSKLYQARPQKKLSQNFLIKESVYQEILAAAELSKDDCVVEVGPGWGFLTSHLLPRVKKVLAVEADSVLVKYLEQSQAIIAPQKLKILAEDILRLKNEDLVKHLDLEEGDYKVVANLPYHITSPIIEKFLTFSPKPSLMVLLVQKEVALRLCASPQAKAAESKMSVLSVATQFYSVPHLVTVVLADSFWPSPKVDSAIVKLRIKITLPPVDEKTLFRLVKIGFSARRKQLHNNLASGLKISQSEARQALLTSGLEENIRPERLAVEDWLKLVNILQKSIK